MASLTPEISFDVKFLLGGTPTLQVTVTTTATSPLLLTGYFDVTQPDGIKESGNYTTPDITGASLVFTKTLRLNSLQSYQKGNYKITLYANHPSYTPGTFERDFEFTYKTVTQSISEDFDLYTPELKYTDNTVYALGGYTIDSESSAWSATSLAGTPTPSTTSVFDLAIGGEYYDAIYYTTYTKIVNYSLSWLTIRETFTYTKTGIAYTPSAMTILLGYLTSLKTELDASGCPATLQKLYEKAETLYSHIRSRVCAQSTTGLKEYFDQFYSLTHNYQPQIYVNTGAIIPYYDFSTGCGGSGSSTLSYAMRATVGVSSFTIGVLSGRTIITASRSQFAKGITTSATTDTEYLQIVGNVVTLPTGDIVATVTLPDLSVVGELFIFTYQ